jgi:hypothetical protein
MAGLARIRGTERCGNPSRPYTPGDIQQTVPSSSSSAQPD